MKHHVWFHWMKNRKKDSFIDSPCIINGKNCKTIVKSQNDIKYHHCMDCPCGWNPIISILPERCKHDNCVEIDSLEELDNPDILLLFVNKILLDDTL